MERRNGSETLFAAFESDALVDPRSGPNAVDLIRAVATLCGAEAFDQTQRIGALLEDIGPARRLVFVLLDGLGINLLDRLSPNGFLRSHVARELRSLAPSTTSCVLTALATGTYPAEHGIPGWYAYLPDKDLSTIPLLFVERFSQDSLASRGIKPEELFAVPSMLPRMDVAARSFLPADFWDSPYSRYWRGATCGEGYADLPSAVDRILASLRADPQGSFTYLYIPRIDSVSHAHGPNSSEALEAAKTVEAEVDRLADGLPAETTLIATADHGQIEIPPEANHFLFDGDPMLDLLQAPPSGESRLPLFHLKPGRTRDFIDHFQTRLGKAFALLKLEEIDSLGLFGPGPISPIARNRFGDFAAIPLGPRALEYCPPDKNPADAHPGRHGGLSPEEMRVPLIIR